MGSFVIEQLLCQFDSIIILVSHIKLQSINVLKSIIFLKSNLF